MYDYKKFMSRIHPNHGKTNEFLREYYETNGDYYEPADDPTYKDVFEVGKLELSDIGEVIMYVYENDGLVPHFHIVNDNFETAICILHPLYYDIHKIDTLTDIQIDELIEYFNSDKEKWIMLRAFWSSLNDQSNIPFNLNETINLNKLKGGNKNVLWSKWQRKHRSFR